MGLRFADFRWCNSCNSGRPFTRRGCAVCRTRERKATRRAKASLIGAPLQRFGQVLKVADDLWSVWLRAKHDRCEVCEAPLPPERLQCAHGISRQDRRVRFHDDNTFALCSGCHRKHTPSDRPPWREWRLKRLGADRFEAVELQSKVGGKLTQSHLQLVILDAQGRIAALPAGPRKEWALVRQAAILERLVGFGRAVESVVSRRDRARA